MSEETVRRLEHFRDRRTGHRGRLYVTDIYFMVTLKRLPGLEPLSDFDPNGFWGLKFLKITDALSEEIRLFCTEIKKKYIRAYQPFIIMPDHIHMIIRLRTPFPENSHESLLTVLRHLNRRLTKCYRRIFPNAPKEIFESTWHDYAIIRKGQLRACRRYIILNARMGYLRRMHPEFFEIFAEWLHWRIQRRFWWLGNREILEEPQMEAVLYSRSVKEGSPEWNAAIEHFNHWDPDCVAVSSFFSPLEKAGRDILLKRGVRLLILCPHGFDHVQPVSEGRRLLWHPHGTEVNLSCAGGQLLFVSLEEPFRRLGREKYMQRVRCMACNAQARFMEAAMLGSDAMDDARTFSLFPPSCHRSASAPAESCGVY